MSSPAPQPNPNIREKSMTESYQGIKSIQIHAQTRYPIVSAYEFEFLKTEAEIKNMIKPCTIYFILQRPLLYFEDVRIENGEITFKISDNTSHPPLRCTFVPCASGFGQPGQEIFVDVQFYKKNPDLVAPYNDVAAIKLRGLDGDFLGWFSPAKFLYEYLAQSISASIEGEIEKFIDYTVHYIGKAFSQDIWKRLTGHEKMQSILTMEGPISTKPTARAPFEISLLLLEIDGFDEANIFPVFDFAVEPGIDPIVHNFTMDGDDDDSFDRYYSPRLAPDAPQLTTEVEALLVRTFKPKYNETLFDNYPLLKNGTRSTGYTSSTLLIEQMPAILSTEYHSQGIILPKRPI